MFEVYRYSTSEVEASFDTLGQAKAFVKSHEDLLDLIILDTETGKETFRSDEGTWVGN